MAQSATGHLRLTRMARTVLSRGELAHWYPQGDPVAGNGYEVAQFAEPVPVRGVIRPGNADANAITDFGDQSSADYYLVTAGQHGIAEDDHLKRPNAAPGADAGLTASAGGFRVGQAKPGPETGLVTYQLDADDRDLARLPVGQEPADGWPTTRTAVLNASDGFTAPGEDT